MFSCATQMSAAIVHNIESWHVCCAYNHCWSPSFLQCIIDRHCRTFLKIWQIYSRLNVILSLPAQCLVGGFKEFWWEQSLNQDDILVPAARQPRFNAPACQSFFRLGAAEGHLSANFYTLELRCKNQIFQRNDV